MECKKGIGKDCCSCPMYLYCDDYVSAQQKTEKVEVNLSKEARSILDIMMNGSKMTADQLFERWLRLSFGELAFNSANVPTLVEDFSARGLWRKEWEERK